MRKYPAGKAPKRTGPNARTRKTAKVAAKVTERTGATNSQWARSKARTIIKSRGTGPKAKKAQASLDRDRADAKSRNQERAAAETRSRHGSSLKAGRTSGPLNKMNRAKSRMSHRVRGGRDMRGKGDT
jgi:hypothetical protein